MPDIFDMLQFGREIEAHGEKWLVVQPLPARCFLAVRPGVPFPAQVHLIQEPEKPVPDHM